MALEDHITKSEKKLLKQIRGYDKDECIQIWENVKGGIERRFPRDFFQKYDHRRYLIEAFVGQYQKDNQSMYPTKDDFAENKLGAILRYFHSNSPFKLLIENGYADKNSKNYDPAFAETPWLILNQLPKGYFKKSGNVKKAVDWLAEKTGKDATELLYDDFAENRLHGLLHECGDSPITIIRTAGYAIKEIERDQVPNGGGGYWRLKANCVKSVKWLSKKTGKQVTELTVDDFVNNGLGGLLSRFDDSTSKVLERAGYEFDVFDLQRAPRGYWNKKENKVKAMRKKFEKLGKPAREIICNDFRNNGLYGLLQTYSSKDVALREAGLLPETSGVA